MPAGAWPWCWLAMGLHKDLQHVGRHAREPVTHAISMLGYGNKELWRGLTGYVGSTRDANHSAAVCSITCNCSSHSAARQSLTLPPACLLQSSVWLQPCRSANSA